MSNIQLIRPDGLANAASYTQVVGASGATTWYISGQVALDAEGAIVGGQDFAAQTDQTMKNLQIALEAVGATFADVVKWTTFVVDYQPEHSAILVEARDRYLPADHRPASTLVGVSALAAPEFLVEIEAIAVT